MNDFAESFSDVCRVKIDRFEFVEKGTIPEGAKFIADERVLQASADVTALDRGKNDFR